MVVGTPALICSLAVYLYVDDPPRGSMEKVVLEPVDKLNCDDTLSQSTQTSPSPSSATLDSLQHSRNSTIPGSDIADHTRDEIVGEEESERTFSLRWDYVLRASLRLLSTPSLLLGLLQGTPG